MSEVQEYKTCRLTIVNPGSSDAVIKIFPAEHAEEKIWLDRRPGIERWEAVKRLMYSNAPRGQYVPDPVKYHPDIKNLAATDVVEKDIPLVTLEGAVLAPPPLEEKPVVPEKKDPMEGVNTRMQTLESSMAAIAQALALIAENKTQPTVKAEVVADNLVTATEVTAACGECEFIGKNSHALAIHKGRFHK